MERIISLVSVLSRFAKINMRTLLITCLLIMISLLGISQNENTLQNTQKFNFGIKMGLNYSKLPSDTIDFLFGTKPLIGIYGKFHLLDNFNVNSSLLYSPKGSNSTSPNFKIKNQYIDMIISFQYEFSKSIFFQTGLSYSYLISSKKVMTNGIENNGINGFSSEVDFPVGIEFKLQDNATFEFNYYIPSSKNNTKNFQISVNILLNNKNKKDSNRKLRKIASKAQIIQLKRGTLLVRLKTSENIIKALKETGHFNEANKMENRQKAENIEIISAFKKYYDFSSILFFYSNASMEIQNKKFVGIFLDDSLKIDHSKNIDTLKSFFIAEFTTPDQDTTKYFSHYSYESTENGGIKKVRNYYTSSTDFDSYDLVIKDKDFIQLNKPFPYFTKASHNTARKPNETEWSFDQTVARMNKKLVRFYSKIQ